MVHATDDFSVRYVFKIILPPKWNWSRPVRGDKNVEIVVLPYPVIQNPNASGDFVIILRTSNLPAIFATLLHWNLANGQKYFSMFSWTWSAHRTLKIIIGPTSILKKTYALDKCVPSSITCVLVVWKLLCYRSLIPGLQKMKDIGLFCAIFAAYKGTS